MAFFEDILWKVALNTITITIYSRWWGCRGRDRMVVGFKTAYGIGACHR